MATPEIPLTRAGMASIIDHTLLNPEATPDAVARLCDEASTLGVKAVCVSAARLPLPPGRLAEGIAVAAVVGFPSGAHPPLVKAAEAAAVVALGATEVDVVIDLGRAMAGEWGSVAAELRQVRSAVGPAVVVKAILETAVLGRGPEGRDRIAAACRAAEEGGADFVKTSTGFHPAGGATLDAVRLMAATVAGRLGVKAAGGIRTAEAALSMVTAGATRIGASSSAAILAGLEG